jgi:phage tail sheath protein FI
MKDVDPAAANVPLKIKQQLEALADVTRTDAEWATKLAPPPAAPVPGAPPNAPAPAPGSPPVIDADMKLAIATHKGLLTSSLRTMSPLFKTILDAIRHQLNLLPPSAAMAGIYTMVDATRGVWKAPANVSLNSVVSPAVSISHAEQEDLNVTTQGKSINAIRAFIGEGVLVWGARTLDGNSLDWRYINVRRTLIMLEESCRLAAKALVFEPNVSSTWVTIKSMISNFLTGIWKRGGLAGAVPDDAFSVHVGLGETMTPDDILEGIMRITVLVAVSRPAEFIEITFQQQMQKS